MTRIKTLDALATLGGGAVQLFPNLAPFAPGIQEVVKAAGEDMHKPETWEQNKRLAISVMGFIPQAMPFIPLAGLVFDIIIASLKAEQDGK